MQAIKTPGTIWARLIEQNNTNNKKPDGRGDAFCYFVGNRGSGKSTLLNRFLYPARAEIPKPSEGLDYTYARKPSQYDHERKDLAHIWEIAGSTEFAEEISQGDQVFLNVKQVTSATVVVTLDLSDPGTVLSSAIYWLDQIKKKLAATYDKFEKKGLQLPEQLRARARSKLYTNNDDKDVVYHSGIAIVLAATKYDTFKNADPEIKKVVSRSLRYLAHSNGAYLVYLGGLEGAGDAGREGMQEKAMLDNFSRLMNHLIFIGLEKKPPLKVPPQTDHNSLIMMPAGSDTLADIGRPRGASDGNIAAGLAEWQELYDKMFPAQKDVKAKEKGRKFVIDDRYKEEEVDKVRARKMEELANYIKEQAAAEEARKKKIAAAKAKASSKSSGDKKASSSKAAAGDKEKPKKSKLAVAS